MNGEVKIVETEASGGAAYNYCLSFGRVDGEEPLVTPGGELIEMELEGTLGFLKGRVEGEESSVVGVLEEMNGRRRFRHISGIEDV